MKNKKNFEEFFQDGLADMLDGERQITRALPKMIDAVTSSELKEAFEKHLKETQEHVQRLEKVFSLTKLPPKFNRCEAIAGLLAEGEEIILNSEPSVACDAALIGAAQKVEHYEIAAYGTLRTFAEVLDFDDAAKLLQETLDEEGAMDHRLNDIAVTVNAEAVHQFHDLQA